MIHSARPTVLPVVNIVFTCFIFLDFEKWQQTDNMCENNDHYRPWMWVGRVDQYWTVYCTRELFEIVLYDPQENNQIRDCSQFSQFH